MVVCAQAGMVAPSILRAEKGGSLKFVWLPVEFYLQAMGNGTIADNMFSLTEILLMLGCAVSRLL